MYMWKVMLVHKGKVIDNLVRAQSVSLAIAEVLSGGWKQHHIFSVIPADAGEVFDEMVQQHQELG